jgi:hypothetical protein
VTSNPSRSPSLDQGGPPIESEILPPTLSRDVTRPSNDFSRKQVIPDGVLIPALSSQRINACHRYLSIVPRLVADSSLPALRQPSNQPRLLTACLFPSPASQQHRDALVVTPSSYRYEVRRKGRIYSVPRGATQIGHMITIELIRSRTSGP